MNELEEIVDAYRSFTAEGRQSVLLTLVDVKGSSNRRPGARMLVDEEGRSAGFIGGGCLEGDLAEHSKQVLKGGQPKTVTYDLSDSGDLAWGLGVGCPGTIAIFIEKVDGDLAALLERWSQMEEPIAAFTLFESAEDSPYQPGMRGHLESDGTLDGLSPDDPIAEAAIESGLAVIASGRSVVRQLSAGPHSVKVLVEYLQPPINLIAFGSGKDAAALLKVASGLNWNTAVVDSGAGEEGIRRYPDSATIIAKDPIDALEDLEIDDRTAVVMMSHLFQRDRALLERLAFTSARYIGLLGSTSRRDALISKLSLDSTDKLLHRLYAPVGLDIGGENPEEVALSVAAEIVAVFSGRKGGLLRERTAPIHDRSDEESGTI